MPHRGAADQAGFAVTASFAAVLESVIASAFGAPE
jgi:hypothetical protein